MVDSLKNVFAETCFIGPFHSVGVRWSKGKSNERTNARSARLLAWNYCDRGSGVGMKTTNISGVAPVAKPPVTTVATRLELGWSRQSAVIHTT